ncbi:MAG: radical SAM protein [Candidatus Gastranaerophilaceae bacterium]
MAKTVRVCHFNKLKIKQDGTIYPCCVAPAYTNIGNVFDEDIIEKIENAEVICECQMYKSIKQTPEDKINLNYIHYETSNACQASCVCCPQNKEPMQNEHALLERINMLIEHYKPKNITAIGGELLIQNEAFQMLFELHKKFPEMKIHTITNLCVGEERIKKAEEIFDEMTVSMLGFTPLTYKNEMGLDFDKVMKNFMYLHNNKKVELRPKYLAMPTNLFEIIPFFNWALSLDVEKIYLHNIHEFRQVANLDTIYWKRTFTKLEKQIKEILETNKEYIIAKDRHFISMHQILADSIHIDNKYLVDNGFDKTIFITM